MKARIIGLSLANCLTIVAERMGTIGNTLIRIRFGT